MDHFFNTFNVNALWSYCFNYSYSNKYTPHFWSDLPAAFELQKNQYRPLRKGISNMIRIHATGAIAMPTEVRIQMLASSKDVIHSWAIPSAGIKLDCIPGYSSHKVFIFLLSGIFWGQCMEICGRYHHWMPIVVYFMKRDLFFLWCLHFVFLNSAEQTLTMADRTYENQTALVSFDKLTWLSEWGTNN
jgi:heme/copper-type cytochrome/quinol oxidase subunit 2